MRYNLSVPKHHFQIWALPNSVHFLNFRLYVRLSACLSLFLPSLELMLQNLPSITHL